MGLRPENVTGAMRFGVRQLAAAFNPASLLAVPQSLYREWFSIPRASSRGDKAAASCRTPKPAVSTT